MSLDLTTDPSQSVRTNTTDQHPPLPLLALWGLFHIPPLPLLTLLPTQTQRVCRPVWGDPSF